MATAHHINEEPSYGFHPEYLSTASMGTSGKPAPVVAVNCRVQDLFECSRQVTDGVGAQITGTPSDVTVRPDEEAPESLISRTLVHSPYEPPEVRAQPDDASRDGDADLCRHLVQAASTQSPPSTPVINAHPSDGTRSRLLTAVPSWSSHACGRFAPGRVFAS